MEKEQFYVEFPKDFNVGLQRVDVDRDSLNDTDIIRIVFGRVGIEDAQVVARTNWSIHWGKTLDLKLKLLTPIGNVVGEWHLVNSKIKDMFFDFGNITLNLEIDGPYEAVGHITIKPEKVIIVK
jgi:hypothetical protein